MEKEQYEAGRLSASYYIQPQAGLFRLKGPDRYDYIQRQTTNDIKLLSVRNSILTVLTSPTARILDVFYLFEVPEDPHGGSSIEILTLPGIGVQTGKFLKSRIFFNDNVALDDISAEQTQIDVLGPLAESILSRIGLKPTTTEDEVLEESFAGAAVRIIKLNSSFGLGWRLLASTNQVEGITSALADNGAVKLSQDIYHILRIENGLPAAGFELSENFTPLEVGLEKFISDKKGCYTGQEIIARQITYDKVTRQLVGLKLEAPVNSGTAVKIEGKPAGVITSSLQSPRLGPIGLGVLKRPYNQAGTLVELSVEGKKMQAEVHNLPFE